MNDPYLNYQTYCVRIGVTPMIRDKWETWRNRTSITLASDSAMSDDKDEQDDALQTT
jgi:hypothetical protein